MKSFAIPYIDSPVKLNYGMISFWLLLTLISSAYAEGPSFEVASLRAVPPVDPTQPGDYSCRGGVGTEDPSRWTCPNISLQNLVMKVFDLTGFQATAILSAPKAH